MTPVQVVKFSEVPMYSVHCLAPEEANLERKQSADSARLFPFRFASIYPVM